MSKQLTRLEHWSESLSLYIDRMRESEFTWGEHDCALFVNGAIKAVTGEDLVSDYAGKYESKYEAAKFLREHEAGTLKQAVTNKLGEPVHPAQAGKGDIVMRDKAVGVCVGRFSYFVGTETLDFTPEGMPIERDGLVTWPTLSCDCAWKVAPTGILDKEPKEKRNG